MIEIKHLAEIDIPEVIVLYKRIFDPILEGLNKDEDKNIWWESYRQQGLLLGAFTDDVLIGFIFFFEKEPGTKRMHCLLTGVDKVYRGQGILKALMDAGIKELKIRGYETMTVSTVNEKMPAMYAYLLKNNFTIYKEEHKDWHGEHTIKSLFLKAL